MTDASVLEAELLSARTPAEAKRHWMIDRMWVGSIGAALLLIAMILLFWRGGWTAASEGFRLQVLAAIAIIAATYQIVVVLAFSLGGPVGRWRARWGDRSLEAEARGAYDGNAQ